MTEAPQAMEIGLILQGGGALGAYEYGGIECLLDLIDEAMGKGCNVTLKAVTGVSIGAINAACVVGAADRNDARRRLTELWNDLIINTPSFFPPQLRSNIALFGVDHFYNIRSDIFTMPTWTYFYDTHPLLRTLSRHVDFDALNASDTAFVITAVDVESGELTPFGNHAREGIKHIRIEPHHVLASGSLPPQFPWTAIGQDGKKNYYWDGGCVDNTPLGYAIAAFSAEANVKRVLAIMNLFPQQARLPRSLDEVNERADQLRFGNRLRQDHETAEIVNDLISTIAQLVALVPGGPPPELAAKVQKYKLVMPVEISLVSDSVAANEYGFRDFSREGVEGRRKHGYDLTLAKLRPVFNAASAALQ